MLELIKKILTLLGLSAFFNRETEQQHQQNTLSWINNYLSNILATQQDDIEKEKQGFYPHKDRSINSSIGQIQYIITNKYGERLLENEHSLVSCKAIKKLENFQRLQEQTASLGYSLNLADVLIDGDEVSSDAELDEYILVKQKYFVITVSGW